jgi:hypothetical protein
MVQVGAAACLCACSAVLNDLLSVHVQVHQQLWGSCSAAAATPLLGPGVCCRVCACLCGWYALVGLLLCMSMHGAAVVKGNLLICSDV